MKPDDLKPEINHSRQSEQTGWTFDEIPKTNEDKSREAAANVIRTQINNLFDSDKNTMDTNPYQKTHSRSSANTRLAKDWQEYHSAWQDYYQKYYEGYYRQQHQEQLPQADKTQDNPTDQTAILNIRRRILDKIRSSANKFRHSNHFIPVIAGLLAVVIFLFLQYNQILISNIIAYISPGNINPQNIVIGTDISGVVSPESRLIIPKINVDVPIIFGAGNDHESQMKAMSQGVAQFAIPGANSLPGEVGNTVLSGHSSNDLFDIGEYKFIFAQLDKLTFDDIIYINYGSTRYTYTVTKKEVVEPTAVNKLVYDINKPILTLITCTPLGTSRYRLLVTAEQISPSKASQNQSSTTAQKTETMPGNSKTLFEKLFNL